MKKRKLGNIEGSETGMGCMGLSHGYGQIPDEKYSIHAIQKAYEAGCTFFDTAEGYGALLYGAGHNEKLLGNAVKPFRENIVLATKFHFMGDTPQGRDKIERMTADDIIDTSLTEWLSEADENDPTRCGFPKCKIHDTYISVHGCQVCTD